MRWILDFVIHYRVFFSLIAVSLVCLWMIASPPLTQAKTARVLTISVFYPFQIAFDQVKRAKNIYAENRRLHGALALLSAQVAQLREQAAENERLRGMVGFDSATAFDLIPVRVVARDPSPIFKSIVVNAGAIQGVGLYMPVVSERGIAGKVIKTLSHLSLVQLINDPLNRTSIMTRRTRAVSILETENGVGFFAQFRTHEKVASGDTVVTTGLGGIYPRGLAVGTIEVIVDEHDPLFKKATIKPTLAMDHLEELFIIRLPPQWASFKAQLDSLAGQP